MDKISNELAFRIIFNSGLLPNINKEYEDKRMQQAVLELHEVRDKEREIYKRIAALYPIKYKLLIDTDDDYTVNIKDKSISSRGYISFSSLEDLEECVNEVRITPDDGFIREQLEEALSCIKKDCGDYYFSGNQTIELIKV